LRLLDCFNRIQMGAASVGHFAYDCGALFAAALRLVARLR
jgi:hypothetical protein